MIADLIWRPFARNRSLPIGALRRFFLGVSVDETTFRRRSFWGGDDEARRHLEKIGSTFVQGYHAALREDDPGNLGANLEAIEIELRGFAYEGAAMALAILDRLTPWNRRRLAALLAGPGARHAYMVHVGAGWALARLRLPITGPPRDLDPLLGWLAVDGYGFHEGYFHWRRYRGGQPVSGRVSGAARRVFDQGLGRSLWFVQGADVARIAGAIHSFPADRHADLWSGIGLASAYAGGSPRTALERLREEAGAHWPVLAQGAAFAAKARERAANPALHTEMACRVFGGVSAETASRMTEEALNDVRGGDADHEFEAWRRRIQERFREELAVA